VIEITRGFEVNRVAHSVISDPQTVDEALDGRKAAAAERLRDDGAAGVDEPALFVTMVTHAA
jgi:hypothetical protein